jgi:hypothetical protein
MSDLPEDKTLFKHAVGLARQGNRPQARRLLVDLLNSNPRNFQAWAWLAYVADNINEKRLALSRAAAIDPTHEKVRDGLKATLTPGHIQKAAQRGTFVCYNRADELFAIDLAEQIKGRGLPCWIDMIDMPLQVDVDWNESVRQALDECGVMLLVLSPEMVDSESSRAELNYFLRQGKIVLPLLHANCDWSNLALHHPPIDFRQSAMSGIRMVFALLGILNVAAD